MGVLAQVPVFLLSVDRIHESSGTGKTMRYESYPACCQNLLAAVLVLFVTSSRALSLSKVLEPEGDWRTDAHDSQVEQPGSPAGFLASRSQMKKPSPGMAFESFKGFIREAVADLKKVTSPKQGASGPVAITDKPLGDPRKYQLSVLPNGLTMINIQDEKSPDAAMAMGVLSGQYNDPVKLPGLAHFCEHMLFLGSKKFPSATGFDEFLSMHGGSSNAFTAVELTDYFFQTSSSSAQEALERFADWFREPSFNRSFVNKEVNAINSENEKNIQNPAWRVQGVFNQLANPESRLAHFHTGDKNTLLNIPQKEGIDTVTELRKYFDAHYCPPKMKLVTYGPASLKEQFASASAAFSKIPKGSEACAKPQSFAQPAAWPPERLGKFVNILGTQPGAQMWVLFPLPNFDEKYASRPEHYLGYVITYGGVNSLSRVLQDSLGLISGLDYSLDSSTAGGQLQVIFTLTAKGLEKPNLVLDVFYSYIATLRRDGANQKLYQSLKDVSKLQWDWAGSDPPADTVQNLAQSMTTMPAKDVLWGGSKIEDVDVKLVNSYMQRLQPDNMIVAVVHPPDKKLAFFRGQKVQELAHYGVKYSVQSLESVMPGSASKWQTWLTGPSAPTAKSMLNEFPAVQLSTMPVPPGPIMGVPTKLPLENMHAQLTAADKSSPMGSVFGPPPKRLAVDLSGKINPEVFYRSGWMTNSPQVEIIVSMRPMFVGEAPVASPAEVVKLQIYNRLFHDKLAPEMVDITATGVTYGVSSDSAGLTFIFEGFAPNMGLLVQSVLSGYHKFRSEGPSAKFAASFARIKQDYMLELADTSDMPEAYAIKDRNLLVTKGEHSSQELLNALADDGLSVSSVFTAGKQLQVSRPLKLSALAMGNLNQSVAESTVQAVAHGISGASVQADKVADLKLEHIMPILNPSSPIELRKLNPRDGDPNDVVVVSVLHGIATIRSRVVFGVLSGIIHDVAYSELRTQRQLGYVVNGGTIQLSNVMGISAVVQGTKLHADDMEAAVESVYQHFMPKKLASLSDSEFESHVHSFMEGLVVPPTSYTSEFQTFWSPVDDGGSCFQLRDKMLSYAKESLTKKQLQDDFAALMAPGARKKIVVKYFAGSVPARPTASDVETLWQAQGVPSSAFSGLRQEFGKTTMLDKADSSTREKLFAAGGQFASDIHC